MEMVYHPDRLKYPIRRKGPRGAGAWERISWDQARDEIADRLTSIISNIYRPVEKFHLRRHRKQDHPDLAVRVLIVFEEDVRRLQHGQ